jgi:hypothetical protein
VRLAASRLAGDGDGPPRTVRAVAIERAAAQGGSIMQVVIVGGSIGLAERMHERVHIGVIGGFD